MVYPKSQTMPVWNAANSVWTKENLPIHNVAFLPVLPFPITSYDTVYTQMKNFVAICSKLNQTSLPIYMDEKVYCIAKEIQLLNLQEFSCLILLLGNFHSIKTLLKCSGKSIEGSGADYIWLNAGIYGPNMIENSILKATHYSRSLEAQSQLAEAMQRLQYKEFFLHSDMTKYIDEIGMLKTLKKKVLDGKTKDSQKSLDSYVQNSHKLHEDIDNYINENSEKNENFRFWTQFLNRQQIVKDLIRADREGLWDLHLDAI